MMKAIKHAAMALCLGTMAVFPSAAGADEAISIAVDSYIYGYPLVTFDMVRRQQTNLTTPDAEHAPMGQLIKMRTYPAVDNRCCAAPNADTLYTEVWLDVSKEPWNCQWVRSATSMTSRLDGWDR